jgi:1,4-dihydroxy-2-naphthoyl-CoA hydrolase
MTTSEDFDNTPVNRWLGMQMITRSSEQVSIKLPVRVEMLQEGGVVQGGILTALADTAAVYLLWPDLEQDKTMFGTTVSMQFLSPATAGAGPLIASAIPVRLGKTISVCESTIHQDDRLIAKGTFTFLQQKRR